MKIKWYDWLGVGVVIGATMIAVLCSGCRTKETPDPNLPNLTIPDFRITNQPPPIR